MIHCCLFSPLLKSNLQSAKIHLHSFGVYLDLEGTTSLDCAYDEENS